MAKKQFTGRKKKLRIGRILVLILTIILIYRFANSETEIETVGEKISIKEAVDKVEIEEATKEELIEPEELEQEVLLTEVNIALIDKEIQTYLEESGISSSSVAYAVEDLTNNNSIFQNEEELYTAASIYKLPLAMLYYDKIAEGEIQINQTYQYLESYNEDVGVLASNYSEGDYISLKYILEVLIVNSDNTAGHMLFESLGGWRTYLTDRNKYSDYEYGEEFFEEANNQISTSYMNDTLRYLYDNSDKYEMLLSNMKTATRNMYLDVEIDSPTAQKYGMYGSALNAAGIVYAENPYSICVLTSAGMDKGQEIIANINEICYSYFNEKLN